MRRVIVALIAVAAFTGNISAQKGKASIKKAPATGAVTVAKRSGPVVDPWKDLETKERLVEITTDYGVMIAKLYDETPLHRDNFVKLVQQKFYDSLLFHRVIDGFMIQGGDPTSKNAPDGMQLGGGAAPGDRIPAEFKPGLIHKKGALAAARDNNPEKASSNCQFYIVQGKPGEPQGSNYTKSQKEVYAKIGGTPFLDQNYTVFGEVISGLDVIDKIAKAPKDGADRPTKNVMMTMRMLK